MITLMLMIILIILILRRNVERFRGGLVLKAHRLVFHSTLGLGVIKKKKLWPSSDHDRLNMLCIFGKERGSRVQGPGSRVQDSGCRVQGSGFRVWGSGLPPRRLCSSLNTSPESHNEEKERTLLRGEYRGRRRIALWRCRNACRS